MCRFLIVQSKKKIKPERLLKSFALICQKSKAPDGELQKDGYGIAWKTGKSWQLKKSLAPIWEELNLFGKIPAVNLLAAHARSAGFAKDKDDLDYNQPFVDGSLCFVFNGMIRKIRLKLPLAGKIGSQKLFSLIKHQIKKNTAATALRLIREIVLKHAEKVEGMNIGLVENNKIHALCQYTDNQDYFTLRFYQNRNLTMVSSQPFGAYKWKTFKRGELKTFKL